MELLINNWYLVCLCIVVLSFLVTFFVKFMKLPLPERFKKVREWLLFAVTQAEQALGSGTGKIKLRMVYDAFLTKFKIIGWFISFDTFSKLVDDALNEFKELLDTNKKIAEVISLQNR